MSWFFLGTWLGHIFGLFLFLVSIIPQDLITYMHNEDYQENLGLKFNFGLGVGVGIKLYPFFLDCLLRDGFELPEKEGDQGSLGCMQHSEWLFTV